MVSLQRKLSFFKGSRGSNFSRGRGVGGPGVQGPSVNFYRNPYNL